MGAVVAVWDANSTERLTSVSRAIWRADRCWPASSWARHDYQNYRLVENQDEQGVIG